jgi:hypothetical protein
MCDCALPSNFGVKIFLYRDLKFVFPVKIVRTQTCIMTMDIATYQ